MREFRKYEIDSLAKIRELINMETTLLGPREVCRYFKIHRNTLGAWRKAGCPALRIGTNDYRFDLLAVKTWLANGRRPVIISLTHAAKEKIKRRGRPKKKLPEEFTSGS